MKSLPMFFMISMVSLMTFAILSCGTEDLTRVKPLRIEITNNNSSPITSTTFTGNVRICRGELDPPYELSFLFDEATPCERQLTVFTDMFGFYVHVEPVGCQRIMRYKITAGERSEVVGSVCSEVIHTDFGIEYYLKGFTNGIR